MNYTCQNCGSTADNFSDLCNPTTRELDSKFCGASQGEVCDGKIASVKYSCDTCGSVSVEADDLCNPNRIL